MGLADRDYWQEHLRNLENQSSEEQKHIMTQNIDNTNNYYQPYNIVDEFTKDKISTKTGIIICIIVGIIFFFMLVSSSL